MRRFTETLILTAALAWPAHALAAGATSSAAIPQDICGAKFAILPGGAVIDTRQQLALVGQVTWYKLADGHCEVRKIVEVRAAWTSSGGDLDMKGKVAVFSASMPGPYTISATWRGASSTVNVFVNLHNERSLLSFGCSTCGSGPAGGLVADAYGNLYGTTRTGGGTSCYNGSGCGTVFELTLNGSSYVETILHSFQGGTDGAGPQAGLILYKGSLYGTTYSGGNGQGTVFRMTPNRSGYNETVLYRFQAGSSGPDGSNPFAALLEWNGSLYGTTYYGGAYGVGTVFRLKPNRSGFAESVLHSFGGNADGFKPMASLVADDRGVFYGTTQYGGSYGAGTVFKLVPKGSTYVEHVIHQFLGSDGAYPTANLVADAHGDLYGTTSQGGSGSGTIFKLTRSPQGFSESLLYAFQGLDGALPFAGLVAGPRGVFYGTTGGGAYDGVVFKITPAGSSYTESVVHYFGNSSTDGGGPGSGPIADGHGGLLGVTEGGGAYGAGVLYDVKP
jgi:uncharacterized repeat protein (TIGR03803 family)